MYGCVYYEACLHLKLTMLSEAYALQRCHCHRHDEAAIVRASLISAIDGAIRLYNPGFIGLPCRNFHSLPRLL